MTRVIVIVAGTALLALSACGGLPDAELDALTAPTPPPICPIDDGDCEEPPAPVIVETDAGASVPSDRCAGTCGVNGGGAGGGSP